MNGKLVRGCLRSRFTIQRFSVGNVMRSEWCHEYGEQARSLREPRRERLVPVENDVDLVSACRLAAALERQIDRDAQHLPARHGIDVPPVYQWIGLCPVKAGKRHRWTERE